MDAQERDHAGRQRGRRDEGLTPPLHAAASRDSADVVRLLLDAGVDVDVLSNDGTTPLPNAVQTPRTLPPTSGDSSASTMPMPPSLTPGDRLPCNSCHGMASPRSARSSPTSSGGRSRSDLDHREPILKPRSASPRLSVVGAAVPGFDLLSLRYVISGSRRFVGSHSRKARPSDAPPSKCVQSGACGGASPECGPDPPITEMNEQ